MKKDCITELIKIELLENTTEEQLLEKAKSINQLIQIQDGFMDAELVKSIDSNIWYFIYHIENMEKLKTVGEKIRSRKLFDEIVPLIKPGSMNVSFFHQYADWKKS